ncbi:MAG: hypothetical protein QOH25_3859 [Acidobacteriota bacterium]|jgi:hypothetical protein|nr:hypothetical protein [Acidobacteriota bacterium]
MNSLRCNNCSFLNFATATACKRCNTTLDAPVEAVENNFFGGYAGGWQPGYQTASNYPQPTYAPQYFPTPVAPLPRASKNGGTNAVLLSLLGVAVVIAAGIGVLWKFGNKPASAANSGWQEYKPQDDSFAIEMPGKPSESVQRQSTPAGEYQMHLAMAIYNQNGAFVIGYADYPSNYSSVPAQQLLDLASQGALSKSSATLVSKRNISLHGYPGLELEMLPPGNMPGGGRIVTRIYWAAPRIYILFGGGPKSSETDAAMTRYFESFKIRKK